MTRVLVTGASGFIGRQIVAKLAAMDVEVHAVARTLSDAHGGAVRWYSANLLEPVMATNLIRTIRPTHLVHAAWIATPGVYLQSPENLDWVQASIALARAFGEAGGTRFVGVGTCAEYAPSDQTLTEDSARLAPSSIYGSAKLAAANALAAVADVHGFQAVWARLFVPYGSGDSPRRLVPSVIAALHRGEAILTTSGEQVRDFITSTDAADQITRILWSPASGSFNIGTGQGTPVRAVLDRIAAHFGRQHLLRYGARALAPGEPMLLVADMQKTTAALGGISTTSVADGVDHAIAEYEASLANS